MPRSSWSMCSSTMQSRANSCCMNSSSCPTICICCSRPRNILRGREQQMQMVGHDDEFMQHEFALLCMVLEHIDHELRGMLAEDRGSFPCDRSDEERPL